MTLPPRFWTKVDNSPGQGPDGECWLWTAGTTAEGYGKFGVNRSWKLAHRLVCEATFGEMAASDGFNGAVVRHTCDMPRCVNPSHLVLGTGLENQDDKVSKARHAFGMRTAKAKLTETEVKEIRKTAGTNQHIADAYGIAPSTVSYIKNRKSWKHI